jgi:dienelactone hydrolase
MRLAGRLVVLALGLCLGSLAHAQAARLLHIAVPSASGPHPAVLLMHGCSGILDNQSMWQRFLLDRGYASANVDSFGHRNVSEICTDFTRVRMHDRVRDAYDALAEMAARPDIDPKRIVLMGFSNGAIATLSALTSVVESQLLPGSPRFRAGVALYPECGLTSARFTAPILTLIGELDDWTPAAACVALAQKIDANRPAFIVSVLPKAHHSFDNVDQRWYYYSGARNINKRSGYGATVEGSRAATERAKQEIEAFLAKELAPAN